jgi:methylmalonyl-CoA mutase N-terminal domain/subunit
VRAGRSAAVWTSALEDVRRAAHDSRNLVPPILTAVEAQATLGEIADVLRGAFGEYRETATL